MSGAVLEVLLLARWVALMVRPGGKVRQLAPNVVYMRPGVCIRGLRRRNIAAEGREQCAQRAGEEASAAWRDAGAEGSLGEDSG